MNPNVIMILIDDMGWADSSTYGSTYYQTPNLSRLAKEGMPFTVGYAASPLCSPTRASIMSGQYPARLHMTVAITPKDVTEPKALPPEGNKYCGLVQNRNHLPLDVFTLAEALKETGYNTAHIGKWHLAPAGDKNSTQKIGALIMSLAEHICQVRPIIIRLIQAKINREKLIIWHRGLRENISTNGWPRNQSSGSIR